MKFSIALAFFDAHRDENHVLLLKFGTGCVQFLLYSRKETMHPSPAYEYIPSDVDDLANRISLSCVQIGPHTPPINTTISRALFISTTRQWLSEVLHNLKTTGIRKIAVTGFVAGSIFRTWERSSADRCPLESYVSDILYEIYPDICTPTVGSSFFMSKGFLEYETLNDSCRSRVVLGIFISRSGTIRISHRTSEDDVYVTILDQNIYTDISKQEWRRIVMLTEFSLHVRKAIYDGYTPVIGLNYNVNNDQVRIDKILRKVSNDMIYSFYKLRKRDNDRFLARTKDNELWDIVINCGKADESAIQRVMKAIWKYAPNRIHV
jgi:hypothetical protein